MDVPDIPQVVTEPREISWPPDFWPSPGVPLLHADTFIQEKRQNASPRMVRVKKKPPLAATDAPQSKADAELTHSPIATTNDPTSPLAPAPSPEPLRDLRDLSKSQYRALVSAREQGLQPHCLSLF